MKLISEGGNAIPCGVNVTDPDSVKAMVNLAVEKTGRLDILVCSAAMDPKFDSSHPGHFNTFEDYPLKQWQDALNVNLTGLFLCAQAAVKPMIQQNYGWSSFNILFDIWSGWTGSAYL
jgi:2-deoxy-D-gluconate 3-dehydrogenase